ncbi:hypothetical protein MGYG_03317 [Nannizzia gypsea CBS 118893]|uniref:Uncharacterized protein n=1 Tax=Arthroderma gypseum (strain ATCC MYA-4604 / CBS 118893) TaxID=535722 RepID=E4UN14_ARTGP|nr:hypothetical protein MGYG_03317 [Nannizzia gypsea CBS 118893]EFR00316.1 hypothetical protein MGYG_03317 [Nannizzia gypsea CBS 118893]
MKLLLSVVLLLPTPIFAAVGGRCSGEWNTDRCICLDHNVCTNTYHGWAYQGNPETKNWACPFDGNNVWGCEISPCPGKGRNAVCKWKNECIGTVLPDPVCPGGGDFVCCQNP